MRLQVAVLALILFVTGFVGHDLQAGERGRGRLLRRIYASQPELPGYQARSPYRYSYPHSYPSAEELYPKYYGSFHYRHLDNIGIPTGDIGIRGNSLYMSPW
jgi:hypothetical protein